MDKTFYGSIILLTESIIFEVLTLKKERNFSVIELFNQ
jgi:hypothetical protein